MNITSQRISLPELGFWLIIVSYLLLMLGSPMPIKIGTVEIVMGMGLTIGVLLLGYSFIAGKEGNFQPLALCIAYFLLIPLLTGVARGNSFSDMARDIAPLMFLTVLPLIISLNRSAPQLRVLLFAILTVGLVNALQFHLAMVQLFGSMNSYISRYAQFSAVPGNWATQLDFILRQLNLGSTDYIASMLKCQDPAILFAAIYMLCTGIGLVLIKPRRFFFGFMAMGGGAFCAYEFSALGMRAFGGLTLLALIVYLFHLVRERRLPLVNLIVAGMLGLILTYNQLIKFSVQMLAKNQVAGLSHRHEELYAAYNSISQSVTTLLFGIGWGGVLANPIYGGAATRFTHSLISFWLLKTGLVGFAMLALFVIFLYRRIDLTGVWASSHQLAVVLAASAAIAVGLIFEPTYKMLSFGMVLGLLLAELSFPPAPLARRY